MHEKPSNHIDINLKFVHLRFTKCRFPLLGRETGGIRPTQNIALSLHVNPLLSPKIVGFVIVMHFLAILPKISTHQSNPIGKAWNINLKKHPLANFEVRDHYLYTHIKKEQFPFRKAEETQDHSFENFRRLQIIMRQHRKNNQQPFGQWNF